VKEDIIDLNVGGLLITSSKKTLMKFKDSVLYAMFSGRFKLTMHNNRIFIDRDSKPFA
jgi:hypothetical protein